MSQQKVYEIFCKKFPQFAEHVEEWFPNGKDSVRVRILSGSDFVFTYHVETDWRFETVESYIHSMKGEPQMC